MDQFMWKDTRRNMNMHFKFSQIWCIYVGGTIMVVATKLISMVQMEKSQKCILKRINDNGVVINAAFLHIVGRYLKEWFDITHIRTWSTIEENITTYQFPNPLVTPFETYSALQLTR